MTNNVQDSSGLELKPVAGSCEHSNVPSHTTLGKNCTISATLVLKVFATLSWSEKYDGTAYCAVPLSSPSGIQHRTLILDLDDLHAIFSLAEEYGLGILLAS
jgi:hypothetical protein